MDMILYGSERDGRLAGEILPPLLAQYRTSYFGGGRLHSVRRPQISVLETSEKMRVQSPQCMVVLKERANIGGLRSLPRQLPVLVWSQRRRQLETLSRLGLCAVSCGLSEKDTLTFSSVGTENSVISLQRNFMGHAPMEIPVLHPPSLSRFAMLTLAAAALAVEQTDELQLDLRPTRVC